MVLNRQKEISIDLPATRQYVRRLGRTLRLGRRGFNVCFVQDREITRLNAAYRGRARPTDVLSFPWHPDSKFKSRNSQFESRKRKFANRKSKIGLRATRNDKRVSNFEFRVSNDEFRDFLGDIVISAPTARRNALAEGHSTDREIRWLILHGVLHLLGYDHETDHGEMTALELAMRERLGT